MKSPLFLAATATLLVAGCASGPTAEQQAALVDDARKASGSLVLKLGGEIKAALSEQGPEGAIGVCKTRAPQIATDVSKQFGVTARRVSPKNRNPAGVPEAIPEGVKARLAVDYPLDKAVGYAPGTLRGIVSVSRPL